MPSSRQVLRNIPSVSLVSYAEGNAKVQQPKPLAQEPKDTKKALPSKAAKSGFAQWVEQLKGPTKNGKPVTLSPLVHKDTFAKYIALANDPEYCQGSKARAKYQQEPRLLPSFDPEGKATCSRWAKN